MSKPIATKMIVIDGQEVECKVYRTRKARGYQTFKRTPKIKYRDMLTSRLSKSLEIKTRNVREPDDDSIKSEWDAK